MKKIDLIKAVQAKAHLDVGATLNTVENVLSHALGVIQEELAAGREVQLTGFGKFEVKDVAARTRRNPRTGETVQAPAGKRVRFAPGKLLKEAVNS